MSFSSISGFVLGLGAVAIACWLPAVARAEDAAKMVKSSSDSAATPFKPIKEADLPQGYPTYTAVGEIEVKDYPATRIARAKDGSLAFWELFAHIKSHNIEMSAPVQMDYQTDAAGKTKQTTMGFLYGDPKAGNTGRDGPVEVVDLPAMKVVCIGMRGSRAQKQLTQASDRLHDWLKKNSDKYEAAGEMRVMGYNSPFIPLEKQFYEVQIPVKNTK